MNFTDHIEIDVRIPFDPATESLYCGRCGRKCEEGGHLTGRFIMCPRHGEFTIGPVVMYDDNDQRWYIEADRAFEGMWGNCKAIDALPDARDGMAATG